MLLAETDYGPFAAAVGYVAALGATVGAIAVTWRGSMKKWRPPEESLPGVAQKQVALLGIISVAYIWWIASPKNADILWKYVGITLVGSLVTFFLYSLTVAYLRYKVETPEGMHDIVGGLWLTPFAKKSMAEKNVPTVQEFLKGVGYQKDAVWSRLSQGLAQLFTIVLYVLTLAGGTFAVGGVGFLIQVGMTGQQVRPF